MPYFMNSPHKSILAALYDCFPAANAVLVFLLDHPLAWFTPKWRRKGRMALKAVRRYINYNRDLLPPERLAEFEESRDLLKTALYRGDRQQAETITAKLESTLESIPGALPSGLAENVEAVCRRYLSAGRRHGNYRVGTLFRIDLKGQYKLSGRRSI